MVPNLDYRESFLKLTRNLAPTGKSFERVEIKSAIDKEATPIIFIPDSRRNINQSLKTYKKSDDELGHREAQLTGILRALHLDKDWIEINIPEDNRTIKIHKTGDVIDDIVGPMVNQRIIVDVSITSDGKYIFRDIQSED